MPRPTITRRQFGAISGAAWLSGCGRSVPSDDAPKIGGRGLVVRRGGDIIDSTTRGTRNAAGDPFTADSPFRAASMSKVVTALTARAMVADGTLSWDLDINDALNYPIRHPDYPNTPITLLDLISHTSGISDPNVYWLAAPGDIRTLLTPDIFTRDMPKPPGQYFTYANLNYGLAATVMEAVSGTRFDRLTQRYVLGPLGLDAGFNWSGVSAKTRGQGVTLSSSGSVVDGTKSLVSAAPTVLLKDGFDLEDYRPGTNGTLFSPQGGLRASLNDLAKLAAYTRQQDDLRTPHWIYDGENGTDEDSHFLAFGRGVYLYLRDASPIKDRPLMGHVGQAYGLVGGMWSDGTHSFAFVDTAVGPGVTMTGRSPNISETAAHYFDKVATIIGDPS